MSGEVASEGGAPVQQQTTNSLDDFVQGLKEGSSSRHSLDMACETVKLLERLVTTCEEGESARELMRTVRAAGRRLAQEVAVTHSLVVDLVRRVLKVVRDEHAAALGKCAFSEQQQESLLALEDGGREDLSVPLEGLKKAVAANLRELMEEFQRSPQDIAAQSEEHVHTGEVIMTFGHSRTVERFLKKASSKRHCQVFVAEGEPHLTGHTMAKSLAEAGVQTTLIQDSAVCALMPRVTKVIVGAHAILANGGLKTPCGVFNMAAAADHYSVPLIALCPLYKLSPSFVTSSDQEGFNYMLPPEDLLPFDHLLEGVEVVHPAFDYVPPELISLVVSNLGANAPAYYCSLVRQMYHPDDDEALLVSSPSPDEQ